MTNDTVRPRFAFLATCLAALAAAGAPATAQTTHTVGPGGFPQVAAALAVAGPGDVVLVQPGTYQGFTASIGVTIRAVTNGTVFLQSTCTVSAMPPQSLHLVDLDFLDLRVIGGTCTMDRCRARQPTGPGAAVLVSGATLCLQNCVIGRPGASLGVLYDAGMGLSAAYGKITATGTTFRGLDRGMWPTQPASPGIALLNCTLHGSDLVIEGGDATSTGSPSTIASGIVASSSTVWLTDSTVRGGRATDLLGSPPFGCPVVATAGRLARCTLDPPNCAPAVPTTGAMLGASMAVPLQSGAAFQVAFRAAPNEVVGVFASLGRGHLAVPGIEQPVGLDLATVLSLDILLADAAGNANGTWSLPPGTANRQLWLQALTTTAAPIQLAPAVGGIVR
jgi:hypothetical protein